MTPRRLRRAGPVVAVAALCLLASGAAAVDGNLSEAPAVEANATNPNASAAPNATLTNATVNEPADEPRVQRPNGTQAGNTTLPAGNATSTRVSEDDQRTPSLEDGPSPPARAGDLPSPDDADPDPGSVNPSDPTAPSGQPPSSNGGPSSSPEPVGPGGPAPDAGPEAPPAPSSPEPGGADPDPAPGGSDPSEDPACQDDPRFFTTMAVSPDPPEPPQTAAAAAGDGGSQDCEDVDDPIEDPLGDVPLLSAAGADGEDGVVDPLLLPSGGAPDPVAPPNDEAGDGEETSTTEQARSASVSGAPPEETSSPASDDALDRVTVAAAILALLVPIVLLYRRLTEEDVLAHERRRNVMEVIREAPGSTSADVARDLGVDYRTARHHLEVLEEFDHVERERRGGRIRFFENHQRYGDVAKALAAALDAQTRRSMLRELLREGSLTSGELAERAEVSRSTASHHLSRLRDADLVEGREEGRTTRYELARAAKASLMELVRGPADA